MSERCPKCGSEMEYNIGPIEPWLVCPLLKKDCRIKELERQLEEEKAKNIEDDRVDTILRGLLCEERDQAEAELKGIKAYKDGFGISDNPYVDTSIDHLMASLWMKGYCLAKEIYDKSDQKEIS